MGLYYEFGMLLSCYGTKRLRHLLLRVPAIAIKTAAMVTHTTMKAMRIHLNIEMTNLTSRGTSIVLSVALGVAISIFSKSTWPILEWVECEGNVSGGTSSGLRARYLMEPALLL